VDVKNDMSMYFQDTSTYYSCHVTLPAGNQTMWGQNDSLLFISSENMEMDKKKLFCYLLDLTTFDVAIEGKFSCFSFRLFQILSNPLFTNRDSTDTAQNVRYH
jgi:hypothetical protein